MHCETQTKFRFFWYHSSFNYVKSFVIYLKKFRLSANNLVTVLMELTDREFSRMLNYKEMKGRTIGRSSSRFYATQRSRRWSESSVIPRRSCSSNSISSLPLLSGPLRIVETFSTRITLAILGHRLLHVLP